MTANSSRNTSPRKSGRKPAAPKKPSADFPLSIHKGSGYWCKKIRGRVHYFGKVKDDPKGKAALEEWLRDKDDLLAGREPRAKNPDALTVADLVNEFLDHHEERRDSGTISPRTFQALHGTCANIVKVLGKGRTVTDLTPDDFGKLRKQLAKKRAAVALRNEMQRARSVFKFAFVNGLIDAPVRYGSKFDKPPLKQVRRDRREHRQQHGARMFEAAEIRQLLDGGTVKDDDGKAKKVKPAGQPLKAMILLAINAGMGQTDLARLPLSSVDLDAGLIDYPRPKTEAPRLCPLWPETVEALREWLPHRPKAKDRSDAGLVFLTCRGGHFVKTGKNGTPIDGIGQEFAKRVRALKLTRAGRSFYALRHSFRTIADETLDPVAVGLIMGHVDSSMADHYRERIGADRLRAVADHVRAWLYAADGSLPTPTTDAPQQPPAAQPDPAKADPAADDRPQLRIVG